MTRLPLIAATALITVCAASDADAQFGYYRGYYSNYYYPGYSYSPYYSPYYSPAIPATPSVAYSPTIAAAPTAAFSPATAGVPSVPATVYQPGQTLVPVAAADQKTPSYAVHSPALGFIGWMQLINGVWQFVENRGQGGGGGGNGSGTSDSPTIQAIKTQVDANTTTLSDMKTAIEDIQRRVPPLKPVPPPPPPSAPAIPAAGAPDAAAAAKAADDRLTNIKNTLQALPLTKQ